MGKFRKKPVVIEAERFTTNNEVGSPTMDRIVNWINQGQATILATHDDTDIFIKLNIPANVDREAIVTALANSGYPVRVVHEEVDYRPWDHKYWVIIGNKRKPT